MTQSQPAWAAWIEILVARLQPLVTARRSPHGLRGLKYLRMPVYSVLSMSQPAWAAWIEIVSALPFRAYSLMSQPAWAAWIEIDTSVRKS